MVCLWGLKITAKPFGEVVDFGQPPLHPAASNKTNLPDNQIAYKVGISPTESVTVTTPIIDKLAFVFSHADPDGDSSLKESLLEAIKDDPTLYKSAKKASVGQKRYKLNVQLHHAASGQNVLIQADPGSAKVAFARFELNPAKLGAEGMAFFRAELAQLLTHQVPWSAIAAKAKVTRLDLACDLVGIGVDTLAMNATVEGKSHVYFGMKGRSGKPPTSP